MDHRLDVGYFDRQDLSAPGCDLHEGMEIITPAYMTAPAEPRESSQEERDVLARQIAIRNLLIPE